jgi:hypothetical protein
MRDFTPRVKLRHTDPEYYSKTVCFSAWIIPCEQWKCYLTLMNHLLLDLFRTWWMVGAELCDGTDGCFLPFPLIFQFLGDGIVVSECEWWQRWPGISAWPCLSSVAPPGPKDTQLWLLRTRCHSAPPPGCLMERSPPYICPKDAPGGTV